MHSEPPGASGAHARLSHYPLAALASRTPGPSPLLASSPPRPDLSWGSPGPPEAPNVPLAFLACRVQGEVGPAHLQCPLPSDTMGRRRRGHLRAAYLSWRQSKRRSSSSCPSPFSILENKEPKSLCQEEQAELAEAQDLKKDTQSLRSGNTA